MASKLTADQILTQFESLIGDSLDQTSELFLLNEVKDTLEMGREWEYLKKLDKSQSVAVGNDFTVSHALPSDFSRPSTRGIYVNGDRVPYRQVRFESQQDFQDVTYAYFIDFFNSLYYLCGRAGLSATILFFYQATSPTLALTANGGLPWIFPAQFHPILPYLMAKKYFAIDQGDKSRSWDDRWDAFIKEVYDSMTTWDDDLRTQAAQNEANMGSALDFSSFPTIINMDSGGPGTLAG
ncbi:MAG: hypothetical protein KGI03_00970 [Patescibacteria group bacterium]|nr:hypothetical protein [Patescibacteria group bacterium]